MKHFFAFCKRNRLFATLLAVELAVLCVLAAGLFGVPYKLTMTPDLFENPFPDIASNEGDHFQVWNQTNFQTSDPLDFPSAGQAVRSGAYEVTVQYFSCQTPDAPTFNMLNSAGTLSFSSAMVPSAVSADTLRLDDCHRTLTTRLWVSSGAQLNDLTATLHYNGQGQLYLYAITLTEQPIYRVTRLLGFALFFAVVDFLLWLLFAKTGEEGAASRRALRLPLALIAITAFACLPLFSNYLYFGHDMDYHLQRISAMAAELSYGQFPVRFTTTTLNGYGYANPLCYCELFLLLPALLYNLWLPLRTCYQIYLFAVTLATCAIAYYSFAKIAASRRLGLLGALLYTLSCYRLVCVYTRAAAGEFTAMAFFPLVLAGLYGIYTRDKPRFADWLPMSLGMAAMVQSHLLSCELTALLLILFCLLRLRETLRPARLLAWVKAALLAVGLSAWYLVPFFLSTSSIPFMVNGPLIGKIQFQGLYLIQLFNPFYNGFAGADAGTNPDMMLSLGLPLILGLGLVVFCLLRRRDAQGQAASILTTAAGFFALTVFLALHIFPWDYVQTTLGRTAGKLAGLFQYPWRFLSLATVLLCLAVVMAVKLLTARDRRLGLTATVVLAAAALFMTGAMQAQMLNGQREVSYNVFSYENPTSCIGVGEYLIDGTSSYETIWAQPKPGSDDLHLVSYEKKQGVAYVSVQNDGGEATISLPIFNYGNYYAADENDQPFTITSGENERIVLTIPANYTGTVRVWYQAPGFWRVFEVISALSLLGTVGYSVFARRKRRVAVTV
ncbi:hypothetical protein [Gemmiger sp.]|uniref:hypothetical protein n=1 Tax=Gemmiger sp. TaxID=2049027 RepID=UPI002670711F|nr:hypothetical protein [uncultured Gemmiger sp.]